MGYFILENPVGAGQVLADFEPYDNFDDSWLSGEPLKQEPPNPIELTWDPDNENGDFTILSLIFMLI